jgi:hypothetical protein
VVYKSIQDGGSKTNQLLVLTRAKQKSKNVILGDLYHIAHVLIVNITAELVSLILYTVATGQHSLSEEQIVMSLRPFFSARKRISVSSNRRETSTKDRHKQAVSIGKDSGKKERMTLANAGYRAMKKTTDPEETLPRGLRQ